MRHAGMVVLGVAGCLGGDGLSDENPHPMSGGQDATTEYNETASSPVDNVCPAEGVTWGCSGDAASFGATSTQPLRIDVVHAGLDGFDCDTWVVTPTATGREIAITYEQITPDTGACAPCTGTLTYWLPVDEGGTWTVIQGSDRVTVEVAE